MRKIGGLNTNWIELHFLRGQFSDDALIFIVPNGLGAGQGMELNCSGSSGAQYAEYF